MGQGHGRMTTSPEGYARLPEDLLHDLLKDADKVVEEVSGLLVPIMDSRDQIREALEDMGLVRRFDPIAPATIAGVDGGFAVERTSAVDLYLAVAVGVEGLAPTATTIWDSNQYKSWKWVAKHEIDAERLARGIMVAQEVAILNDAPHAIRILDGSHLTLVIQLNAAVSSMSNEIRGKAREVWTELQTAAGLSAICNAAEVVAMPKYDSSRTITQRLEQEMGFALSGDDKYLLSLILRAGELLEPQQVPRNPWSALHISSPGSPSDRKLASDLEEAIAPLRNRAIAFTYFKPDEFSPAFRLEVKQGASADDINLLCSTLSSQITGPFVREPYPQYLADVMAKSVGLGLTALQSAVELGLSGLGRPEIAEMLIRSYRTEGV